VGMRGWSTCQSAGRGGSSLPTWRQEIGGGLEVLGAPARVVGHGRLFRGCFASNKVANRLEYPRRGIADRGVVREFCSVVVCRLARRDGHPGERSNA